MRVLVCGGRNYNERGHIWETLYNIDVTRGPIDCIIHGAATGADSAAMLWAQMTKRVKQESFAADWKTHGKGAGPIRNQRMLDEGKPDLVVAFPGGKGTADMVRRSRIAGVEVVEAASHPEDKKP